MVSLCYQAHYFEMRMNLSLTEMASAFAKSNFLLASSETDLSLSKESQGASISEKEESQSLEEHAQLLLKESSSEEALATTNESKEHEIEGLLETEKSQALTETAEIASLEALYENETAKASGEAAIAAKDTASTESDGLASAACELIPFLDVVCGLVGGATAVGMQAHAAQELTASASDYAAATAAKNKENGKLSSLAGLETEMESQQGSVSVLTGIVEEEENEAAEERAQAKEEEERSKEKLAQSEEDLNKSKLEQEESDHEKDESAEEEGLSLEYALKAFENALLSTIMASLAMTFFVWRMMCDVIYPNLILFIDHFIHATFRMSQSSTISHSYVTTSNTQSMCSKIIGIPCYFYTIIPKRKFSYFFLHCSTFFIVMLYFSDKFAILGNYNSKSRGGIILLFSAAAAALQSFLLHVVPTWRKHYSLSLITTAVYSSISTFFKTFCNLMPLFAIEAMILWVNFGTSVFNACWPHNSNTSKSYYAKFMIFSWIIYCFSILLHHYIFDAEEEQYTYTKMRSEDLEESHTTRNETRHEEESLLCNTTSATMIKPKYTSFENNMNDGSNYATSEIDSNTIITTASTNSFRSPTSLTHDLLHKSRCNKPVLPSSYSSCESLENQESSETENSFEHHILDITNKVKDNHSQRMNDDCASNSSISILHVDNYASDSQSSHSCNDDLSYSAQNTSCVDEIDEEENIKAPDINCPQSFSWSQLPNPSSPSPPSPPSYYQSRQFESSRNHLQSPIMTNIETLATDDSKYLNINSLTNKSSSVRNLSSTPNSTLHPNRNYKISKWRFYYECVKDYIIQFKLPFEVLVLSCVVVLFKSCVPHYSILWPLIVEQYFHPKAHPRWQYMVYGISLLLLILLFARLFTLYCLCPSSLDEQQRARDCSKSSDLNEDGDDFLDADVRNECSYQKKEKGQEDNL